MTHDHKKLLRRCLPHARHFSTSSQPHLTDEETEAWGAGALSDSQKLRGFALSGEFARGSSSSGKKLRRWSQAAQAQALALPLLTV